MCPFPRPPHCTALAWLLPSTPSQLVEQKAIENTFSLCFGYPSGGTMILGASLICSPLPGSRAHALRHSRTSCLPAIIMVS